MAVTRKSFTFLFLLLTFSLSVFAASGGDGRTNEPAVQSSQVTEFEVNGLKVLIKRRPSSPTVAGGLFIRGGARNINAKNAGIENLTLASAIEAGKKFSRQAVRRMLSSNGSGIAAGVNNDYSVISLVATRPSFDRVWEIFTDVTLNPLFAPEDVERNRSQILSGLREKEIGPDGALQSALDRAVYSGHSYENNVTGTPATIQGLAAADLRAYHQKIMQNSQLLLVFVGDLDPEDMKARIAASFGKLPKGDYKEQAYPALDFSRATVDVVARPNLPTNYVEGVFNAPNLTDPDYYPMRVAMVVLQSLVYQEVRVKRQLSYAPGADMNNVSANTANISVTSNDANQSVRVMLDQVNNLRVLTLNEEVISEVGGNFLTSYYLGQESSTAQAGELARYELIGGGWRNSLDFMNRIRKVTAGDVRRVSEKYMKNIRFVVVGNPASVDRKIFLQGAE